MEQGLPEELRHIPDAQAPHQIETVDFDRAHADLELMRNFSVGEPVGDQTENFLLSWC